MERFYAVSGNVVDRALACEEFVSSSNASDIRAMSERIGATVDSDLVEDFNIAVMTMIALGNRKDLEAEFPHYANCNPENHDWNN